MLFYSGFSPDVPLASLVVDGLATASGVCPPRTYYWLILVLGARCTPGRIWRASPAACGALGLQARCYGCLLDFFYSPALCPDRLARGWTRLVLKLHPGIERCNGRIVVLADGLKKGKCGRKMPAVKLLHQSGASNPKPELIMGHSCQTRTFLGRVGRCYHAIPLCARIHEGLVASNRDQRTLLDQLLLLLTSLQLGEPGAPDRRRLLRQRQNPPGALRPRRASAAARSLERLRLRSGGSGSAARSRSPAALRSKGAACVNSLPRATQTMPSPAYGATGVTLRWMSRDLLWPPRRLPGALRPGHSSAPRPRDPHVHRSFPFPLPRSFGCTPCASKSKSLSSTPCTPSAPGPTIFG